ncbi:MAG: hypothetical protein ACJ76N_14970 [Thermoanaerobaculia bacterium]
MKKNELKTKHTSLPALCKETLRQLDNSELQGVAGAGRIRVPVGFNEDTTPVYDYVDEP